VDRCFAFIDHDERLDTLCAFRQMHLQAVILNLVRNVILALWDFFIPDLSWIFDMCSAEFHV